MSEIPGGWTEFNFTISAKAKAVFDTALKDFCGVGYDPLAFATQVVKGTNYCFLCKATVISEEPYDLFVAKVYIYQPLDGPPCLIKRPHDLPSDERMYGWTEFNFPLDQDANDVWEVTKKPKGVDYHHPVACAKQSIKGMDTIYCFLCHATVMSKEPYDFAAKVYICQLVEGPPCIREPIDHDLP